MPVLPVIAIVFVGMIFAMILAEMICRLVKLREETKDDESPE
jgi:hypothetical protein